jgi:hypothetical protein
MNAERGARNSELKERTFEFGLRIVRLVQSLPKVGSADILGRQLLRAEPQSAPTIVQRHALVRELISSQNWELPKRSATKRFTGWTC